MSSVKIEIHILKKKAIRSSGQNPVIFPPISTKIVVAGQMLVYVLI